MSSILGPRKKLVCCDRDRVKHTGHWLEFRMFLRRYSFAALATQAGGIVAVRKRQSALLARFLTEDSTNVQMRLVTNLIGSQRATARGVLGATEHS
jgi:hypothetical protein